MSEYRWSYIKGDLIAAITVAGIYLPMALSLADNLAHVPPINGLYSFFFNPLIYALLGSCPQMVVGPEAAGSLLVGTVVKTSVDLGRGGEDDDMLHAQICGVVAGMAGATVLVAGLARLGFLDSVLSRPFLRGFISAIGFVILVDQLVPELGLGRLAAETPGVSHGSTVDKLTFMFGNLHNVHRLTAIVAAVSFVVIMLCRSVCSSSPIPIFCLEIVENTGGSADRPIAGRLSGGCSLATPTWPTFQTGCWWSSCRRC